MNASDPKLPMDRGWQTAMLKGPLEGSYLAKASDLDFGHNWNGGKTLRFDTPDKAKCERRRLHLKDCTVVEEVWGGSGRRGSPSKHQFVIRRVYQA